VKGATWAQLLGGVVIGGLVLAWVGAAPALAAVRALSLWPLVAATGIGLGTTLCCAWRWTVVARALHVGLSWPAGVAAYYRSQFLNTTVPGGIVGDVHRGLHHGRAAGDRPRALEAVLVERWAGQAVLLLVAGAVLVAVPSPVHPRGWLVAAVLAVLAVAAAGLASLAWVSGRWQWARTVRDHLRTDWVALRSPAVWLPVALASLGAVAGHLATFLLAAHAAGSSARPVALVPMGLVVLVSMGVPLNVAGWGPREGAAAWAFSTAGFGAAQGVTTAAVYGLLTLVACLPGAGFLLLARAGGRGA
jgi:uncharacterized membrane protein YbhN (UPF0104 family)